MGQPVFPRPGPGDKVVGFTAEEKAAMAAESRSGGAENPPEVLNAFTADGTGHVAGLTMRPVTLGTYMLLERLDNGMVDPAQAGAGKRRVAYRDVVETLLVLTRTPAECRAILDQGKDAWEAAIWGLAESLPAGQMQAIGQAVNDHFNAAFSTMIAGGATGGEKKTVTASPAASPAQAIPDSAGGSSCSIPSAPNTGTPQPPPSTPGLTRPSPSSPPPPSATETNSPAPDTGTAG